MNSMHDMSSISRIHAIHDTILCEMCRETIESYISELQKLSMAIFGLIAEALKIERTEVENMFEDGMQAMRITYYPPCPEPNKVIGLTPHSDGSGVTILLQVNGVEGFQVKKDGVWLPVRFLPNAFVVNLGDIAEVCHQKLQILQSVFLYFFLIYYTRSYADSLNNGN